MIQENDVIIQLLQQQTTLLQQLLQSSHPVKTTPAKRTTLRQQVHNDFKQTFYEKWKLSTNPPATSPRTSAKNW